MKKLISTLLILTQLFISCSKDNSSDDSEMNLTSEDIKEEEVTEEEVIVVGTSYCGSYTISEPVSLDNVSDITISGLDISNPDGNCIALTSSENVIIENCKLGASLGEGVSLYNCTNVIVRNCSMNNVSTGVYANSCSEISVINNEFLNIQGPIPRGQMVQFNNVNGAGNEVNYNIVENIFGESDPIDVVNMYETNGTVLDPVQIKGNWIRGGGPNTSGGGILVGDKSGSNFIIEDNILVNPGQYGIAVASGKNIQVLRNKVYAKQQVFTNVGIYVWNQYDTDCNNITISENLVNWTNKDGAANSFWNGNNCGDLNLSNNDWHAAIDENILEEQIISNCE